MRTTTLILGAAAIAMLTTPAFATRKGDRFVGRVVADESNPWYRDYQTDLSEARRELKKDLADAKDEADRGKAYAEYEREVADARHDFTKEMRERGLRSGTVTVEPSR